MLTTASIIVAKESNAEQQPATIQPAEKQEQKLNLPENAIEVSPGVFYLGKSMDKGKVVEGYVFVHYAKGYESAAKSKPSKSVIDDTVDIYKLMYGGIKWADTMQYKVNPEGNTFVGIEDVMSILSASLETWDTETSFELFNDVLETTTEGFDSGDRINRITWDDLGSSGIIAANYFWFNPATKEILESDVRFNTYYTWADCGVEDCAAKMDLQNIATHEFGHNGLNDLYMPPTVELTMYGYGSYGETSKRDLETGDISGIQALYGE